MRTDFHAPYRNLQSRKDVFDLNFPALRSIWRIIVWSSTRTISTDERFWICFRSEPLCHFCDTGFTRSTDASIRVAATAVFWGRLFGDLPRFDMRSLNARYIRSLPPARQASATSGEYNIQISQSLCAFALKFAGWSGIKYDHPISFRCRRGDTIRIAQYYFTIKLGDVITTCCSLLSSCAACRITGLLACSAR